MKKSEVLGLVNSSVSSIFSKEDVINLINGIENESKSITVEQIEEAIDTIINELQTSRLVDLESAELEINYNRQVELTDVEVDFDLIRDTLTEVLTPLTEVEEVEDDLVELERGE
jgi:dihydroxyacetone kinase DhaKLM complex PTS-EIIA-like component DhaM